MDAAAVGERSEAVRRGPVVVALSLAVLYALLVLPDHADRITVAGFLRLPAEAIAILALLLLTTGRWRRPAAVLAGASAGLAAVLKVADIAAFQAFARPFNPVLDFHLLGAAMNLLSGAIGPALAFAAAVAAVVATLAVMAVAILAALRVARAVGGLPRWPTLGLLAAAALAWAGMHAHGTKAAGRVPVAAYESARSLALHARWTAAAVGDLAAFEREAAVDALDGVPAERLFGTLRGKDVIVAFVESYGRTVIDNPLYAPAVTDALAAGGARLAAAGVGARSAFLTSPTVGGMSWLAHGTLLSGLWVDNQRRYDSLMVSDRMTLNRAFRDAGWRTVAVMPAITMAWPEGAFYGYDEIYPAAGLGYRGKPFNWVTMPDQYTWSALRRLELERADRRPVMAELALISSHAPWTPVPRLVPWQTVGDGTVFDAMAGEGDPPDVVWRDPDRVRLQFRLSVEYALETAVSYATSFDLENTVIVIVGDHQPAPLVTGEDAGRDVPVHILSGDPEVLRAVEGWGWTDGLLPAADAPVWQMDAFRDRFIEAFSPDLAGS